MCCRAASSTPRTADRRARLCWTFSGRCGRTTASAGRCSRQLSRRLRRPSLRGHDNAAGRTAEARFDRFVHLIEWIRGPEKRTKVEPAGTHVAEQNRQSDGRILRAVHRPGEPLLTPIELAWIEIEASPNCREADDHAGTATPRPSQRERGISSPPGGATGAGPPALPVAAPVAVPR